MKYFYYTRKPLNAHHKYFLAKTYLKDSNLDFVSLLSYFYTTLYRDNLYTNECWVSPYSEDVNKDLDSYVFMWLDFKNPYIITDLSEISFLSYLYRPTIAPLSLVNKNIIASRMVKFIPLNFFHNLYNHKVLIIDSVKIWAVYITNILRSGYSFTVQYLRSFIFILFIDACLTDDEPLWEPIEWSLVQTWLLFIFTFAWIAENLIVSRYGSYSGRDKRVWMGWYKTFWLIEGYYVINYGIASIFVIVPFYYETNYNLSFVYSWWHWYSRTFFYKFTAVFTIVMIISQYLQINVRSLRWNKALVLVMLINIFLAYLLYTQFIITFFGYLTDPAWYQKTRPIDYVQLSHEPARWGWDNVKRDHFTYHNVKTVFWFKNDGPFASSFVLFQMFLFVCIFLLFIYWITLFRRIYSTNEIPLTYTTYCVSSLKQFFYFFAFLYVLVILSFLSHYARFPIEFLWTLDNKSWLGNFLDILFEYPLFIINLLWK